MGRARASTDRVNSASTPRSSSLSSVRSSAPSDFAALFSWTSSPGAVIRTALRWTADIGHAFQMPIVAAVAYYLGAQAAFFVGTLSDQLFAPFWPPNIVLLCALVLTPYRRWVLYLLAAFPAHVFAEIGIGMNALQILVAFATNVFVALLSATAVKQTLHGPPWFKTVHNMWLYVLSTAVAAPVIVSFGGAFVPIAGDGSISDYWTFYAQWYMSNALGSLALGPTTLICLGERDDFASLRSGRRAIEAVVISVVLVIVCATAFHLSASNSPESFLPALLYAPLPFVLWAAVRFGVQGAGGALLIITVVLVWRTLNGPSLFLSGSPETNVFAMQCFLLSLSVPVLLLGAAIDEARHAEQAIRESEERMSFAATSANLCLWRFDYKSDQFWITDHGRGMLGFPPLENLTRTSMIDAVHPDDRELARDAMRAAIAENRLADCEFRIVRRDGELRWLRCRARAHGEDAGQPAQISGTFTDITEQKARDLEIAQQRQELAHLTRVSMLGELSGGIAHELLQPLTAIQSNAEAAQIMLAQAPPMLDEVTEILGEIVNENHRANEVIHRLRRLLKKSETKFEPTDINDLVKSTLQLLHNEVINRRVKIAVRQARDLPLVLGDAVQLQQVLINLVLNAMDAMNETVPSRRAIIVTTHAGDGNEVEVVVSDRGTGLTPHQREHVFQPFFTTKEHGLGLGLSLSSVIIHSHGGTLNLDNNASGGVTAALRLPSVNVAEAAE